MLELIEIGFELLILFMGTGGWFFLFGFTWTDPVLADFEGNQDLTEDEMKTMLANGVGFLGDVIGTRIKLLPSDFNAHGAYTVGYSPSTNGATFYPGGTTVMAASVRIPTGYKATHVMVYGSDINNVVNVYECEISDGVTATNKGTGVVATEINITDVDATNTNYLAVWVSGMGAGDYLYCGYVTIDKI